MVTCLGRQLGMGGKSLTGLHILQGDSTPLKSLTSNPYPPPRHREPKEQGKGEGNKPRVHDERSERMEMRTERFEETS